MNEIVNTFLLARDKFMPEMHLKKQDLLIVLSGHLLKTKKEFKIKKKRRYKLYLQKLT